MIYAYNNIKHSKFQYRYNQSDYDLSETMARYWVNFVKNDNPSFGETVPPWQEWSSTENKVQELGRNVSQIDDPFYKLYSFFEEFEQHKAENPE